MEPTPPIAAPIADAAGLRPPSADDFIPVRYRSLTQRLIDEAASADRRVPVAELREVAGLIADAVRRELDVLRDAMEDDYDAVNPDREPDEAASVGPSLAISGGYKAGRLMARLAYVFANAGFRPVSAELFDYARRTANVLGVEVAVDPSAFDLLFMFERGRARRTVASPGFLALYDRQVEVEVIRRLGVVVRRRGSADLHVKIFKDIPLSDLEAVLPDCAICMAASDRWWLAITIASVLFSLAMLVLDNADVIDISQRAVGLFGMAAAGWAYKIWYSYSVLRAYADGRLNRQLYFQHLTGNEGVLNNLLETVARQLSARMLTAYLVLLGRPADAGELRRRMEGTLSAACGRTVTADPGPVIEDLRRWRLLPPAAPAPDGSGAGPDAPLAVPPPAEAVRRLREAISETVHGPGGPDPAARADASGLVPLHTPPPASASAKASAPVP